MAQYLKLAGEFSVKPGNLIYVGPVIAGPDFLVAVPQEITTAQRRGMSSQGLIGGLLAGAMKDPNDVLTDRKVDIPDNVLKHPDWPGDRRIRQGLVFFKDDIKALRVHWWGGMTFALGDKRIAVPCGVFRRGKINTFLRDSGYAL